MRKILLVEDNVSFRESLKDVLRTHFPGVQIVEAGDGQEALRQMTDPIPNLVLRFANTVTYIQTLDWSYCSLSTKS